MASEGGNYKINSKNVTNHRLQLSLAHQQTSIYIHIHIHIYIYMHIGFMKKLIGPLI